MLQVFCGNNTVAVREAAFAVVHKFEKSGVNVNTIDSDGFVVGSLRDAVGSVSLFGGQELFVIDEPSLEEEFANETKDLLPAMAESGNIFVVVEGALLAPAKKPYQKHASVFEEIKAGPEKKVDVFAMADSLSRKDKRTLWLQLQNANKSGSSAEEIIGIFWWQLKTMRLAQVTTSASEAGVKDFPYNKAKGALRNYKEGEVRDVSNRLLEVYHQGHRGEKDIDLALEEFVLTL